MFADGKKLPYSSKAGGEGCFALYLDIFESYIFL